MSVKGTPDSLQFEIGSTVSLKYTSTGNFINMTQIIVVSLQSALFL